MLCDDDDGDEDNKQTNKQMKKTISNNNKWMYKYINKNKNAITPRYNTTITCLI